MAYKRKTTTAKTDAEVKNGTDNAEIKETKEKEVKKAYAPSPTDSIPCHSIIGGYVNFRGGKTGTVYSWYDNGDVSNVEYQDLRAAMLSKSAYIFDPIIIIDNEDILNIPEWKPVKDLYENMYSIDDLTRVFDLPTGQMTSVINKMPRGAKKALITLAKTLMDDGRLADINKIKALDKLLGTDLLETAIGE